MRINNEDYAFIDDVCSAYVGDKLKTFLWKEVKDFDSDGYGTDFTDCLREYGIDRCTIYTSADRVVCNEVPWSKLVGIVPRLFPELIIEDMNCVADEGIIQIWLTPTRGYFINGLITSLYPNSYLAIGRKAPLKDSDVV